MGNDPSAGPGGEQPSILVVDDNEINQRVAVGLLRRLGHAAEAVASGEAALKAVAEKRYRLMFMDCMMPGMDGLETTRKLRESEGEGEHLTVVAMTGKATEEDRRKCLEAGMDDYITKPILKEELQRLVQRWLAS
ncbi:response regulator [Haliangium ochraceum]|uniref:Response regulator receiver protein n=1 Tax=Haliangium ochraceum (strain DSM 14365 / JCM 11303 / SMP-2) TaxID=502025 RepID=D0LSS7_HALO1|nr:response regulator [Haliangium ochraceum]ACY17299.1 response regulator receiver protein [Haliangium ochraceum DSM 14365]